MAEPDSSGKIPLTLHLPAELAARLKVAAGAQKRPAADLAVELLERHLPRLPPGGEKKVSIPYA
jgi:hypothetical protein